MRLKKMGEKLRNAPLFYVLSEVRFGSVEAMDKYIPDIQEYMRQNGFPDFRTEPVQNVNLREAQDGQPVIETRDSKRWIFNDFDIHSGFILTHDRLVFHTTNYDTFKTFSETLRMGLQCIDAITKISFIKRTGIRYVDVILPNDGEDVELYMNPSLHGFKIEDGSRSHNIIETSALVGNGTLISRAAIFEEGLNLPPDLVPLAINPISKFERPTYSTNAIFDFDHFVEKRFEFDVDEVISQIDSSHVITGNVFRHSASEYAIKEWN